MYNANKRAIWTGAAASPKIARSAASFNQTSRKIAGRELRPTKHRDPLLEMFGK